MDANNYNYGPLDPTERSLRLLVLKKGTGQDIQCDIVPTILGNEQLRYEAVSYTWGPDFKSDTISIRGRKLPVTFNLNLILRDLRKSTKDRILWIDAVCINQDDQAEKGQQVQQMKDIFSSAERVLFCISRPTEITDLLMLSLKKLQEELRSQTLDDYSVIKASWGKIQTELADNHLSSRSKQIQGLKGIHFQGLKYILEQSWFRRVWILQEVANARDALVYCGTKSVSATVFVMATRLIGLPVNDDTDSHYQMVREVLQLMPRPSKSYPEYTYRQDLYSLLQKFRHAEATEEHDKIYALFGMCTDMQANTFPKVDYKRSMRDVLRDMITHICRCDVRSMTEIPYNTIDRFLRDLDSLDNVVLLHFLNLSDATNASFLLRQRGAYIKITPEILEKAANNIMQEKGVMELLLQQGDAASIFSSRDEQVQMTWWWAVENAHEAVVKLLIERGIDVEAENESTYKTALHLTAESGHEAVVKLLIERGANLEARDNFQETPLHLAASSGQEAVVKLLIEKGVNLEAKEQTKQTPLHLAAENGHESVVKLLIEKGVNLEAEGDILDKTALHLAAGKGHEAVVKLLIEKGVNLEAKTLFKRTALHLAARSGHEAVVKLLIEKDADYEAKDMVGDTPYYSAINGSHQAIYKFLKKLSEIREPT
jgi:ankyrin repeat protein